MIVVHGLSDIGLKRTENEDYFIYGYNQNDDFIALVCDGVGGAAAGKIASELACKTIFREFENCEAFTTVLNVKKWIFQTCQLANDMIISHTKKNPHHQGMSTTVVGVIKSKLGTFVFNIGDSRVYGLFDKFVCLTKDHNYERYIQEKGDQATIDFKTKKYALTNALGIYNVVEVDILKIKETWKRLLVCSDGVHNYVSNEDLIHVLTKINEPHDKCQELINIAKINSGKDNITAIVIERRNRYGEHH